MLAAVSKDGLSQSHQLLAPFLFQWEPIRGRKGEAVSTPGYQRGLPGGLRFVSSRSFCCLSRLSVSLGMSCTTYAKRILDKWYLRDAWGFGGVCWGSGFGGIGGWDIEPSHLYRLRWSSGPRESLSLVTVTGSNLITIPPMHTHPTHLTPGPPPASPALSDSGCGSMRGNHLPIFFSGDREWSPRPGREAPFCSSNLCPQSSRPIQAFWSRAGGVVMHPKSDPAAEDDSGGEESDADGTYRKDTLS